MAPSLRPLYTPAQISKYYDHISLPHTHHISTTAHQGPHTLLVTLTTLQKYNLASIPFENLSLHYSLHHTISLDSEALYDKLVEKRRGGYCMENNCFFGTVLRTLGYDVCSVGARVNAAMDEKGGVERYVGWYVDIHFVLLAVVNVGGD